MIKSEELQKIIEQYLLGTDKFIVELKVKAGNNIVVLLDGDTGVNIDDCVALTRHIESQYDREVEDYTLMVSSAGLGKPFKLLRQYLKNLEKEVEVELTDKTLIKGTLLTADKDKITVKVISKVKKEITEQDREIPFDLIKEVREVISFK
ncbi:MAG: ribosome assembly cofactor RimP [Lentimicrobiaceae bacterium]